MEWFLLAIGSLRSNLQSLRKMASKLEHLLGICPSVLWHTDELNLGKESDRFHVYSISTMLALERKNINTAQEC